MKSKKNSIRTVLGNPIIWLFCFVLLNPLAKADDVITQNNVGLKTTLDPLRIQTIEDIKKRDQTLEPVFKLYSTATIARGVQALESAYGLNAYYYVCSTDGYSQKRNTLANKQSVMAAIVPYFLHYRTLSDSYAGLLEVEYIGEGYWKKAMLYPALEPTPLSGIDPSLISGSQSIDVTFSDVQLTALNKKSSKISGVGYHYPFLLGALIEDKSFNDVIAFGEFHHKALFSTDQRPLFEAPVIFNLEEALKKSEIKSFDATIVFMSSDLGSPYKAVYPDFTPLAPIPQPIIYISFNATPQDLAEMIDREAPRVFAYDTLFSKNLLPEVADIDSALAKYPKLEEQIRQLDKEVRSFNKHQIVKEAFLDFAYTAGLTSVLFASPPAGIMLLDSFMDLHSKVDSR